MSHAVHYQDAAGEMRLEDVASLDAALERVEALRNSDGATEIRVFREVPIEVRTYYRVVAVPDDAPNGAGAAGRAVAEPTAEPRVEPAEQVVRAGEAAPADGSTAEPEAAEPEAAEPPVAAQAAAQPAAAPPPMEPPPGAMVISRQSAAVAAEPSAADAGGSEDATHQDHRRLFSRS